MEFLKDMAVNKFWKPSIFSGRKCIINLIVYWWWMERNGTQD